MLAVQAPTADEVVTIQMAETYRSLALAGVHYAADLTAQLERTARANEGLRERLAERDLRIAALAAEISRYTRSMVAEGEAA